MTTTEKIGRIPASGHPVTNQELHTRFNPDGAFDKVDVQKAHLMVQEVPRWRKQIMGLGLDPDTYPPPVHKAHLVIVCGTGSITKEDEDVIVAWLNWTLHGKDQALLVEDPLEHAITKGEL